MAFNFKPFTAGEPIDVTTLSKMSEYIVSINSQLVADKQAKSSPHGYRDIDTSDMAIWTGQVLMKAGTTPNEKMRAEPWSASFDIPFAARPIVTVTPYCDTTGGGTIAPIAIWLNNITLTGVKGSWKWLGTTTRVENIYALIIAIGPGQIV